MSAPASPRRRRRQRGHAQASRAGAETCGSWTSMARWPHCVRQSALDDGDGESSGGGPLLDPTQSLGHARRLVRGRCGASCGARSRPWRSTRLARPSRPTRA
jgi:hypothetical protein